MNDESWILFFFLGGGEGGGGRSSQLDVTRAIVWCGVTSIPIFYNNCQNSRALIGLFLLLINWQKHD